MMKRNSFYLAVLFLGLTMNGSQLSAQKTDRVEKLLKLLVENDLEKLQKNREKIDEESNKSFAAEIGFIDVMTRLQSQPDAKCAADYYPIYAKASKAMLPSICTSGEIDLNALRGNADKAITALLKASPEKLTFSKQLIDLVKSTSYPVTKEQMELFCHTRESELMAEQEKQASIARCESYFEEFPEGKYEAVFMNEYNQLLYYAVKRSQTDVNFKKYFDNMLLNKYFNGMSNRKYTPEVQALYDDYLYSMIQESSALSSKKQSIDAYESSPYLVRGERKHAAELEYVKDSVEYALMIPEVNSESRLELIKGFLVSHKYKEFRDKARTLSLPFEEELILTTPAFVKYYAKGRLNKIEHKQKGRISTETYTYLDDGKLAGIETKSDATQLLTSFLYDAQGRCAQEIQVNARNKKEVYKKVSTYNPDGSIQSDSLKYADGRLVLSKYNQRGDLAEEQEFSKDVMLWSVSHQYDSKGNRSKTQTVFPLPKTPAPTQVSSQIDLYEYDKYGYLTKINSTQLLVNNEKRTCSEYFMYDEFGNPIESNMLYEYDRTGRWIRKTAKNNPEYVEQIQCSYKLLP